MDDSGSLDGANADDQRTPLPTAHLEVLDEPPRNHILLLGLEGRAVHRYAPTQR